MLDLAIFEAMFGCVYRVAENGPGSRDQVIAVPVAVLCLEIRLALGQSLLLLNASLLSPLL